MLERTNFYGLLDSVRFGSTESADGLSRRRLAATGAVMLDLLAGSATPVLSHAQAYDSAAVLDVFQNHDKETGALRDLVRRGLIRVLVPRSDQVPALVGDDAGSLINWFALALTRPDYVFSGWPQLSRHEVREDVLDILRPGVSADGHLGDPDLEARLEGLRVLDGAVAESPVEQRANPAVLARLPAEVSRAARHYAAESLEGGDGQWLATRVDEAVRTSRDPLGRSQIYRLLTVRREETGHDLTLTALTSLVDGVYNELVAQSLHATGSLRTCATEGVANALADLTEDASNAELAIDLALDPRRQEWLRWQDVERLATEMHGFNATHRLRYLERCRIAGLEIGPPDATGIRRWSVPVDARTGGKKFAREAAVGILAFVVGGGLPGTLVGAGAKAAGKVLKTRRDRRRHVEAVARGSSWRENLDRSER